MEDERKQIVVKLYEIGAFKFGDFKMKIGLNSPIYFDLRVIISYPELMNTVSKILLTHIKENSLSCNHVCGVPYTALPLATLVSVQNSIPMLIRRKEAKNYGTKKVIEGIYKSGDKCLIIEDVITSGLSILETVRDLRDEGITVNDAVVIVDREQGGAANLLNNSVRVLPLFTLSFLLNVLREAGKIPMETITSVSKYIQNNQITLDGISSNSQNFTTNNRCKMPFEERANLAKCELAKDLFMLMASKKTNLCLAADFIKSEDVLDAAEKCGPYICVLKTHVDIIDDFSDDFISRLTMIAKKHNFLIMEDRKYADIGNTVCLQYSKGIFKTSHWADLVTAHSLSGPSILESLKLGLPNESNHKRGVFLLGEMSTQNNLIDNKYKEATNKIATQPSNAEFVAGIVCQDSNCFSYPGLIQLTPGVKIGSTADQLDQSYRLPEYVVQEKGADIAVVGRGILEAKSMETAAALYRDQLWAAYVDRLKK